MARYPVPVMSMLGCSSTASSFIRFTRLRAFAVGRSPSDVAGGELTVSGG